MWLASGSLGALHVVIGVGGSARAVGRAAATVVESARNAGWTPSVIDLADLPARLPAIERLVLCGGDGLVHRAVQHVAGSGVEVAVVPVGSGNDFVRAFGIDGEAAVALASARSGTPRVRDVDLLVADGTPPSYAATVLTAGYSGRVNATANRMRFPPGSAKYSVAAVREIGRLGARFVKLTLRQPDGSVEVIEEPMTLIAIGNTAWFGGGMAICPDADPGDGLLDVVTVGPLSRLEFARWLPSVFKGGHCDHPQVTTERAAEVTIETNESLWADGEPFTAAPVTVRAAPAALRLLVPD
jgi:diacylglycerol kinase family enzyme